jgi:WD40 repeat protein
MGFNADGSTLAIIPMRSITQCSTNLIDVATGSLKTTLTVGTTPISEWDSCSLRIYFSNDNQRLITASSDRDSELWDIRTGRQLAVFSGTDNPNYTYWEGTTEMFSPDGKTAVTAQTDFASHPTRTLNVWDVSTGKLLRSIDAAAEPVRFSPDGKFFAARSTRRSEPDSSFSVWDVESGKLIRTFRERKATARDIAWSPDGRTIAVSGDRLRIWDVESGKLKATLPVVVDWEFNFVGTVGNWDQLFFSPDSRFLIVANKKSTRIIDVKSAALLEKIDKLRLGSFTPDGNWITLTTDKKSVAVWEIRTN